MITLTKNAVYVVAKMVEGKNGYGLRLSKIEGCCSVLFNLHLDKKKREDRIIKSHGSVKVFGDPETLESMRALNKKSIFKPATIDYIKTHLGQSFFTNNHRLGVSIWEHDIE